MLATRNKWKYKVPNGELECATTVNTATYPSVPDATATPITE